MQSPKHNKSILNNSAWIIGCKLIQAILCLIVSMLTARYLGPSNYGLINYAVSLVTFVTPIMKLGLDGILVFELVKHPEREGETLGTVMGLSLFSALLCMIGVVSFASIVNTGEAETLIVCALYSISLFAEAIQMLQYWFQAKLLSKYTSLIMLAAYILKSAYQIYLLVTSKSVYWFAVAKTLDIILIDIGIWVCYKRFGGGSFSFSCYRAKELFAKSKYYILSGMMVVVFAQTDRIMIKMMIGNEATGFYSAAVTCAGLTGFVFAAIIDSFRPDILASKNQDDTRYQTRVTQLYSIVIYGGLLQSIVIFLAAPIVVDILYGSTYHPAVSALRIVVWYTSFSYLGSARNIWILAEEKQSLLWKVNLCGALANVILNAVLIPVCGINGAAFASFITQFFTNAILCFVVKPLRPTGTLMLRSLNPQIILGLLRKVLRSR